MRLLNIFKAAALSLPAVVGGAAFAEPILLDCKIIDEAWLGPEDSFQVSVTVDFEAWSLQFANWTPLPIVKVNEKFVTAIGVAFDASPVGGYVISLRRDNGHFMLRGIGPDDGELSDRVLDGTCVRPQF